MMRNTFDVFFYVKKGNKKANGKLPLMCRLTVGGEVRHFRCRIDVPQDLWCANTGCAAGRSAESRKINDGIARIRADIGRHYYKLMRNDGHVTADRLKDSCLGLDVRQDTLLKLFEQHNVEFEKKVGFSRAKTTLRNYMVVYKHVRDFIAGKYKSDDIPLTELDLGFINDFEYYLRAERKCRTNSVWQYMIILKHIVSLARNDGRLPFNPFAGYINMSESVDRGYLTKEEIKTMMKTRMPDRMHELIRDLFLFSTFTGLAYSDVKGLTTDNLQTFFDGNLWIIKRRKKTNTQLSIRILDIPKRIIDKYRGVSGDNRVFPVPSNTTCNKVLKRVAVLCGIEKHLTYHMARHSAATTIMLSNGVPIETVSRLLGHTNVKTTQIYARITAQKISSDLEILSSKLGDMSNTR